ncbi:phage protein NinX family protein [Xenorhabdus entomophaga]|uniref:phage protein NinX family protein n=1 Tax=Xenorhabdus entomophaga TaxID=3136257 RepID=UPI0030F3A5A9
MKIKTSELTGRALDWAVARAVGMDIYMVNHYDDEYAWIGNGRVRQAAFEKPIITVGLCNDVHIEFEAESKPYSPSTDWARCGPLIEKHHVELNFNSVSEEWSAYIFNFEELESVIEDGDTPQIAICRAVVAAQLGDEVEIPDELMEGES